MVNIAPSQGPSDQGISFRKEEVTITCTDALSKGDIVLLTLASGAYAACTKAAAATASSGIGTMAGVATEAVAAGAMGKIGLRGIFDCNCSQHVDAGVAANCSDSAAGRLAASSTNPADDSLTIHKVIAIGLEATASDGDLTSCLFDGINGFATADA
tara:strand:- start:1332 stop:1802 length:471 start_codon:yes stop_codon:yes gene_type:complete